MSGAAPPPLRILMHCVYFPPEVGGLESHVFHLARELADLGHHVDVVTSRSRPGTPAAEIMDGIHVHRTWFPGRSPAGWVLHALGSIPTTRRLARDADVVHAQAFASVIPGMAARRVAGAPLVTTWHTSHFLMRAARPGWRPVFRWMLRRTDWNLAASREIAAVGEGLAPGVVVEALTNGVDTERFRPVAPALPPVRAGRRRLIVPRRLYPKNGVEYAVRALPELVRAVDAEMIVVGDGPERGRLEALALELGVRDRITFLGARPHTEIPALLASAELAVFPSLMEATSVAALECLSCRVPVAASRVGGLPEIVDDAVGGLFEPGDPQSLADTVLRLLRDPGLADRGRIGRARVEASWSNARLARRHLEIYRALREGRTPHPPAPPSSPPAS
ncbi:MAG: glycosyltransferase family 4 protein [Longimicrobiales bacterium]|nr:glycosyltransferase family 4 protein [Longimicrobiales bacterium]